MPNVEWDPEKVLGPPGSGHIERRLMEKRVQTDKKFAAEVRRVSDQASKIVLSRRLSRSPPDDDYDLIEFFLDTPAEDMEFEAARCRPRLSRDFFAVLDKLLGAERFAPKPDEDRLAELEALRTYLTDAAAAVDATIAQTASAAERMRALLSSKDKKEMILEMAGRNEIDQPLIDLLKQNIEAARAAEQPEAAGFMEKVMMAASKFLVVKKSDATVMPEAPARSQTIDVTPERKLIL